MIEYKQPPRKLTLVDLFAGCGGLSLGMEYAGFSPIFVGELNESARRTYIQNRSTSSLIRDPRFQCDDIRTLTANPKALQELIGSLKEHGVGYGEIDLLAGGPPCQGFSRIGFRRTFRLTKEEIPSNHLYEDMALMVEALQPRVFLFENVRGLLTARWRPNGVRGEIWSEVFNRFKRIKSPVGYDVAAQLVYSSDYGVPQHRPRVLMVGVRKDLGFIPNEADWEEKAANAAVELGFLPPGGQSAPHLKTVLGDLVELRFKNGAQIEAYPRPPQNQIQSWYRSRPPRQIADISAAKLTHHEFSLHSELVLEKFRTMVRNGKEGGASVPWEFKTKKFVQRKLPSFWAEGKRPSVTVTSLPDDFVHFSKPRTLSVREWARLQTFPDWYQFAGSRTTGGRRRAGDPAAGNHAREVPQYTQIGNAVPVKLAYEVGLHLRKILLAAVP